MTTTQDAIAAFLAKGGKVAKVSTDATCGMTDRQWHRASRDVETITVVGRAYLPSHAFAIVVANCLYELSDRNHYAKAKSVIAEFNADPLPDVSRYNMRLQWCIGDMLAAIEDAHDNHDPRQPVRIMSNDLWNALRAASKSLR